MPRLARTVFPGVAHHITQRGNRREDVFFTDDDRNRYLEWLKEYTEKHQVDVLAYCLMTNHIHLVLVPTTENGLQSVLKPLHMRYAQHVNRSRGWKGYLSIYGKAGIFHLHWMMSTLGWQYVMLSAIRYELECIAKQKNIRGPVLLGIVG